uniref:alpha-L-arabinofuranosidase C-terminal domain-containing protein n=1 Tax=Prevotella sp. TaxID=59823 RepID=UPI0040258571
MGTITKALSLVLLMAASHAQSQVTMDVDAALRGPLTSPYQYGLFFEEINHAGEGGLYAELVKNRSFEDGTEGWQTINGATMSMTDIGLLNKVQGHALTVAVKGASAFAPKGIVNNGYWGMALRNDSTYTLSLWVKGSKALNNHLVARLVNEAGTTIGEATLAGDVNLYNWTKLTTTITAHADAAKGNLQLLATADGTMTVDVISLFPATWKGRANGLRPDLAQLLADTHPTFLRFPGGCYVEGQGGYDNAFQWKKTIGPIEQRPGHWNRNWGYWSSDGLGFDEYLQLCEDLGAAPLFVVNVGLGHGFTLSLEDTKALVQDCLDAIEYANGEASTTWGAKRVANGHAAPYHLKFIEIGNENYQADANAQSNEYAERYKMFYDAIKAKYHDIVCIGNVEAWGTDSPSWRNANPVELVDEHYYRSADWMIANYNKYDNVSRSIGIYNGEYAANGGSYGKYGNLSAALGEAVYMLGMERNSDVCRMASFAPIFTHESNPTWAYDMIHFDADKYFVTPSYYVQKLMGSNLGTQNLKWTETGNTAAQAVAGQKVGVGAWYTKVSYDDAQLLNADGTALGNADFSGGLAQWTTGTGSWSTDGGVLAQSDNAQNCTAVLNIPVKGDYTYKVRARKDSGSEGFLIIFNYQDSNNYLWWNIGGWGNTQDAVERCVNGGKTTIDPKSFSVNNDQWYDLEVDVRDGQVTCKRDGETVHTFSLPVERSVYQSVQLDTLSNQLIVKLVNPYASARSVTVNLKNMEATAGTVQRLQSAFGTDENTMDEPNKVVPAKKQIVSGSHDGVLTLDAPAYSLSIYRYDVKDVAPESVVTYPAYEAEDKDKAGYLYVHMSSKGEFTSYSLSRTGQYWTDLLSGSEVFSTKDNTITGGMRDAYVTRLEDGSFMLVGTDMTSRLGWTSNHIMDLMLSPDLVHWTKNVKIDLESSDNLKALGGITADQMTAAWAPQVIYDPVTRHYVVYYSVGFPDRHRIYYQLVDKDLNILTEPRLYFDPGYDIIDADIVYNAVDNDYQMVYKCEKANGFNRATAPHLVPADGDAATGTTVWTITDGFHVSDNNQTIEAPTQWREIGQTKWKLSFINYGGGYGYKTLGLDEHGLQPSAPVRIVGSNNAQHGSILKLTQPEYDYLLSWDSVKTLLPTVEGIYKTTANTSVKGVIDQANEALTLSTTFEENTARMTAAAKALSKVAGEVAQFLRDEANQGRATDLTPLIANADFSKGSAAWETTTSFTQANGQVAEFYNKNFDFHQTITNLPAGDYEIGVQSFFRYGNKEVAYATHADGSESLDAVFYANDVEESVMSLYKDSSSRYTFSPYTYPDNVSQANEAFNTYGLYNNIIKLTLAKAGDITLGIRKESWTASDWCCFDNFTLRYLGQATGIRNVRDIKSIDRRAYTLTGRPVDLKTGEHGVYIQDGKKIVR